MKDVIGLIASCRLCLFSPLAVASGADVLLKMFVPDEVWHRFVHAAHLQRTPPVSSKDYGCRAEGGPW